MRAPLGSWTASTLDRHRCPRPSTVSYNARLHVRATVAPQSSKTATPQSHWAQCWTRMCLKGLSVTGTGGFRKYSDTGLDGTVHRGILHPAGLNSSPLARSAPGELDHCPNKPRWGVCCSHRPHDTNMGSQTPSASLNCGHLLRAATCDIRTGMWHAFESGGTTRRHRWSICGRMPGGGPASDYAPCLRRCERRQFT